MTKPYTSNEIMALLALLSLTQIWLADQCHITRQSIYNTLHGSYNMGSTYRHLLLFTYILNEYMRENGIDISSTVERARELIRVMSGSGATGETQQT